jgi:hypothetical protein
MIRFITVTFLLCVGVSGAAAREIGDQYDMITPATYRTSHITSHTAQHCVGQSDIRKAQLTQPWAWSHQQVAPVAYEASTAAIDRPADCYGIAWCGCYLRHLLGVADKAYNLAITWARWGTDAGGPRVGAVAVSGRHVALIVGPPDERGLWLINDGNDGPVRIHRMSIAWARYFRVPS